MKRLLLFVSFCPLIFSCKKEPAAIPPPPEPRLLALTHNAGFPDAETISILYDAGRRILAMQSDENSASAQGSYSGNQVLITSISPGLIQSIRLVVNGSGRVTKRFERTILSDEAANETRYSSDTTDYFYDSNGLLIRSEGKRDDTTRNSTDATYIGELQSLHTTTYVNTNKMLASMKVEDKIINVNSAVYHTNDYVFAYDQGYDNKLDFKNAVVLNEMSLFEVYPFPINKNYGKLPNKVTHNETYKDENGVPFYTNEVVYNTVLTFDEKGAVSKIDHDTNYSQPLTFVYQ